MASSPTAGRRAISIDLPLSSKSRKSMPGTDIQGSKSRKSLAAGEPGTPKRKRSKYAKAEVLAFADIFKSIDKDGSGKVDIAELTQAFAAKDANGCKPLNAPSFDPSCLHMFRVLDRSNAGHITLEDFLRTYYGMATPAELAVMLAWVKPEDAPAPVKPPLSDETRQELTEIFRLYDKNKDGKLQRQELLDAASACGYEAAELERLFAEADKDDNGALCLEEFIEMMRDSFV